MKVWLLRALILVAIGAYYYNRKGPAGDRSMPPTADRGEPIGAAAGS